MPYARLRNIESTPGPMVEIERLPDSTEVRINGVKLWTSDVFDALNAVDRNVFGETLNELGDRIEDLENVIEDVEDLLREADHAGRPVCRDKLRKALDQSSSFELPTTLGSVVKASKKGNRFGPQRRSLHLLSDGTWLNWEDKEVWKPADLLGKWTDFEVVARGGA